MQIVEVKNDIVKILYNTANNRLLPSDFVLIDDFNQKYIAQVLSVQTTENADKNTAVLRLALSIDNDDNLGYYNGNIPSKDSQICYVNPEDAIEIIKETNNNVFFGNWVNHPETYVQTPLKFLENNLYILSDKIEKSKIIVKNLVSSLSAKGKKSVIIDFSGTYTDTKNAETVKICEKIKLPLNVSAFSTILKNDLQDCPLEDKNLIQGIFLELREYILSLEDKFLPFSLFRNVVNSQYEQNPMSGLLLLKNQLWYYAQQNLFADQKSDFNVIDRTLLSNDIVIIDASGVSEKWSNYVVEAISSLISDDCFLFLNADEVQLDKKLVVNLYNSKFKVVFSSSWKNDNKNLINNFSKNKILLKTSTISEGEYYSELLNNINYNEMLVFGEDTLYIPFPVYIREFDDNTEENVVENDIKKDVDRFFSLKKTPIVNSVKKNFNPVQAEIIEENIPVIDSMEQDISYSETEDVAQNLEQEFSEEIEDEAIIDDFTDSDLDFLDELDEKNGFQSKKSEEINEENNTAQSDESILPADTVLKADNLDDIEIADSIESVDANTYESTIPAQENESLNQNFDGIDILQEDEILPLDTETSENSLTTDEIEDNKDELITSDGAEFGEITEETESLTEETEDSGNILVPDEDNENYEESLVEDNSDDQLIDNKEEVISSSSEEIEKEDENNIEQNSADISFDEDSSAQQIEQIEPEESETNEENIETQTQRTAIDSIIDDIYQNSSNTNNDSSVNVNSSAEINNENNQPSIDSAKMPEVNAGEAESESQEYIDGNREQQEIPIYETDSQTINTDELPFKTGDIVYHPKHGKGIVEGFTNYNNKILFCQIEFENVGRRILDPKVANLRKIEE